MKWHDHIEQHPKVMVVKPVICGTRIAVELILERLGNGATEQDMRDAFPHVTSDDIRAARAYAAAYLAMNENIFVEPAQA